MCNIWVELVDPGAEEIGYHAIVIFPAMETKQWCKIFPAQLMGWRATAQLLADFVINGRISGFDVAGVLASLSGPGLDEREWEGRRDDLPLTR
jgi:hypothetical protein